MSAGESIGGFVSGGQQSMVTPALRRLFQGEGIGVIPLAVTV